MSLMQSPEMIMVDTNTSFVTIHNGAANGAGPTATSDMSPFGFMTSAAVPDGTIYFTSENSYYRPSLYAAPKLTKEWTPVQKRFRNIARNMGV